MMTSDIPSGESPHEEQDESRTLKYHLLGPSLTKAGQDKVDQNKVSEIIYNASRGSKFFNREEVKDKALTHKIQQILVRKRALEQQDLTRHQRNADRLITELEVTRDLSQFVVHVDCDAFYAAVEQLDRPELKDVPFAVGGGVLTTCNYLARKFGCRSGMAGFVAKKLCPELLLIKPNFEKYTAKAREVREILADYDPRFESASIDEAYLNITEYCEEKHMAPADVVDQMRRDIHLKTNITVSAGLAANAKLAKICSNMNKPNGQYVLPNDRNVIMAFMRDLPTRKVNGIGRVLERELLEIGVKTCGDIFSYREYLYELFGEKTFDFLINVYLGLGRTRIQPAEEYERKSVGTESSFHEMSDAIQLREKLRWTAEELEKDMKRAECKGRTLCLKIKLHTFEVYTRQVVTPRAVSLADDLFNHSLPMLSKLQQEIPGMKLRLMGLRCTHLISTKRPDTMTFFGFRPQRSDPLEQEVSGHKRKISEGVLGDGGEDWPGDFDGDDLPNEVPSRDSVEEQGAEPSYRRHGKEITANPKMREATVPKEEEWWDCPICSRPQAANERLFNEHIDLCLSRQTIRDAVQKDNATQPQSRPRENTPEVKRAKTSEKRRGKTAIVVDPKQKRLFFGQR
ncbi:hypothetical protein NLU13_5460 [Sarocladium strictum]|uniref:DNA polymerase kappa n=1 Tax=Sarocladium strictum TaxID=5046 RepID=A0AA39GJE9_SARSR|nr:hypothetical protein NLU13_5460 [Sarocladium strictum]